MRLLVFVAAVLNLGLVADAFGQAANSAISGELRCWHKVTLSIEGPQANETDTSPNPFTNFGFWVDFEHLGSGDTVRVPGYFAADGDAGESSATTGNVWRAHLAPHRSGDWRYTVHFTEGPKAALDMSCPGEAVEGVDGLAGNFAIAETDKSGRDFRGKGQLQYVAERYLRFAQTGERFLKAGADAPETLLAYKDFDGTTTRKAELKTWKKHHRDWREGDPQWQDGKGHGLIGAFNYLASKGMNSVSFLPYNAGGDGDNVWPMVSPDDKLHYDCSKLDQWQIVFDHAQTQGLFLHFKLQETENDDERNGKQRGSKDGVKAALDGGRLGVERKLYCKELVARFGYELALNWNLGEENTQSFEEQADMARYFRRIDPYDHPVVLHTYPPQQEKRYRPHVGVQETLTGVSLQNEWHDTHRQTKKWVIASLAAGHPWVCANDEQGPADQGVPPDDAYASQNKEKPAYTQDDIRKRTLWGNLMAGGAGVEYYFGYKLAENDLNCQDWRSRDNAWDDCRQALEFFAKTPLPLVEMLPHDELVLSDNTTERRPGAYCLAKPGEVYLVYLLDGGDTLLDLSEVEGQYAITWYDPRHGGDLIPGSTALIESGGKRSLGKPPAEADEDWLAVIRRQP